MPHQATYLAAHRVPGRAYVSSPRHRYRGPLGDQITSMEARFYFHPENPQVRLSTRTLGPFGHAKVAPFPQPCLGAYKGTLWGPVSEIAGTQVPVAGNSNLKLVLVWTSSSVKGMSVLKSDYALGQHAVPVSLELA